MSFARSLNKAQGFLMPYRRPTFGRTLSNSSELSLTSNHSGRSEDVGSEAPVLSAPGTPVLAPMENPFFTKRKCTLVSYGDGRVMILPSPLAPRPLPNDGVNPMCSPQNFILPVALPPSMAGWLVAQELLTMTKCALLPMAQAPPAPPEFCTPHRLHPFPGQAV